MTLNATMTGSQSRVPQRRSQLVCHEINTVAPIQISAHAANQRTRLVRILRVMRVASVCMW